MLGQINISKAFLLWWVLDTKNRCDGQLLFVQDINYQGTRIVSGGLDNMVCVWSTQDPMILENMAIARRGPLFKEFR